LQKKRLKTNLTQAKEDKGKQFNFKKKEAIIVCLLWLMQLLLLELLETFLISEQKKTIVKNNDFDPN
jgi:hypothetical protein